MTTAVAPEAHGIFTNSCLLQRHIPKQTYAFAGATRVSLNVALRLPVFFGDHTPLGSLKLKHLLQRTHPSTIPPLPYTPSTGTSASLLMSSTTWFRLADTPYRCCILFLRPAFCAFISSACSPY